MTYVLAYTNGQPIYESAFCYLALPLLTHRRSDTRLHRLTRFRLADPMEL
jgi:hypothetical protein